MTTSHPPRRIALVASSFAPYIGGVERHVEEVARELLRRGHAVEVWTVDREGRHFVDHQDGLVVRRLPAPLPTMTWRGVARWGRLAPQAWRAWRAAHATFRPDVLHVQCFGPNGVYADALGRVTRTPRLISSHGETLADDHDIFSRSVLLREALRLALRNNEVTGCSRLVSSDLEQNYGARRVTVVPNAVQIERAPAAGSVDRSARHVVGVGRLERNKGFDLLLDAVSLMPRDVSVELVGEGALREDLEARAARLGLGDRFQLVGKLDHPATLRRIAGGAVLCVPSRKEAFGMVVLEAWAVGTPVVATAKAGPADLITHGQNGLLVDPEDAQALAAALEFAMQPAQGARLAEGGERSLQEFSWRHTVDLYEGLYVRGQDRQPHD